jgi:lipopolysaccharide export system permease protein
MNGQELRQGPPRRPRAPRLRTLERYLARLIYGAVGFVLLGFLALFAFFDLIKELGDLGNGDYQLQQVFAFVLLTVPGHAYELFPIAVLIGTLYVLAQLASNSEYTVMRGSGLSPARAALVLGKIGLAFVALTFVIGEWVAPYAEEAGQKVKLRAMSKLIGQDLQSGLWFKDEGSFINVREARQANSLSGVRIFEFDGNYRLRQMTVAERGEYRGHGLWMLLDVIQTQFTPEGPRTARMPEREWRSAVSPDMLDALIVKPERLSAWALHKYIQHLAGNRQKTELHEIALWKKLLYPLAALVMMALALPFAYMSARAGAVGLKVFLGIMLGIFFHMLNSLISHIGLLQNWSPFSAAAVPSAAFLAAAMLMMWWVERR